MVDPTSVKGFAVERSRLDIAVFGGRVLGDDFKGFVFPDVKFKFFKQRTADGILCAAGSHGINAHAAQ